MNKLYDLFPFDHIRPAQKNILDKIEPFLHDEQIRYIVIEAGTGVGKSAIAKTLSAYYKKSYLLTSTKSLQEQYKNEFYNESVKVVKGKSNYYCNVDGDATCDIGPCKKDKGLKGKCLETENCPYYSALKTAENSEMFVCNYAYFLSMPNLNSRNVIIIDECHLLDDKLIELAKFKIDMDKINKKYNLINEKSEFIDVVKWKKKFITGDSQNNINTLNIIIEMLTKKMEANKSEMIRYWQLSEFKDRMTPDELNEFEKIDIVGLDKENNEIMSFAKRIQKYIDTCDNGNWVTTIKEDGRGFYAVPIFSKELFEKYIGKKANKKVIFMSATIFGKDNFCEELGLDPDKTMYFHEESTFDPKRSPIVVNPCLSFKQGEYDKTIASAGEIVKTITNSFRRNKGIIHTGNYKVANFLTENIPSKRYIYRKTNENNEDLLMTHAVTGRKTILVSPSMMSGVDLKDDYSRFQIIMKLPYPNLQNPRMAYISKHNFKMYAIRMLREFIQACGRSTRSEKDWSVTYVLDKSFINIYKQFKKLMPYSVSRMIDYDKFKLQEYVNYIKK